MNDAKHFLQSKTIWLGVATMALSGLMYFQGTDYIQNNPALVSAFGLVIGAITVYLRTQTSQSVTTKTTNVK